MCAWVLTAPWHASYLVQWTHIFMLYATELRLGTGMFLASPITGNMQCVEKPTRVSLIPIGS